MNHLSLGDSQQILLSATNPENFYKSLNCGKILKQVTDFLSREQLISRTQGVLLEPPASRLPLTLASGSQLPVSCLREPEEGRDSHRCDYSGRNGFYLLAKVLEASLRVG